MNLIKEKAKNYSKLELQLSDEKEKYKKLQTKASDTEKNLTRDGLAHYNCAHTTKKSRCYHLKFVFGNKNYFATVFYNINLRKSCNM